MVSSGFPGIWKVFLYFVEIQLNYTKPALTMCMSYYWKNNNKKHTEKGRARVESQCNHHVTVKRALLDFNLSSFHPQFQAGWKATVADKEFPIEEQAVLKAPLPLALSAQRKACTHLFSFHCCRRD